MLNVFDAICTQISNAFPEAKIYFTGVDSSVEVSINSTLPEGSKGAERSFDVPSMIITLKGYKLSDLNRFMYLEKLAFRITMHFYSNILDRAEGEKQIEKFVKLKELFSTGLLLSDGSRVHLDHLEAGMSQQDMFLVVYLERTLQKEIDEDYDTMKTLVYNQKLI
ncbi:MAG: hypothetical protein ACOYWZ_08145 [Bacillota bacterium]